MGLCPSSVEEHFKTSQGPGTEFFPMPNKFKMATLSSETCKRIVFHNRPGVDKVPTESNFAVERIEIPQCKEGEILVKTMYLSVDPYMRCRMNEDTGARGGYLIYPWVGRCGVTPHTLTLFKTNIADFPTLFKTEFRFLIPCLRHLTRILINKSL